MGQIELFVDSMVLAYELHCYVDECADNDQCGVYTDLQPTNTTVEMDCTTGVHVTRSGGYINHSDRGPTRVYGEMQNCEM